VTTQARRAPGRHSGNHSRDRERYFTEARPDAHGRSDIAEVNGPEALTGSPGGRSLISSLSILVLAASLCCSSLGCLLAPHLLASSRDPFAITLQGRKKAIVANFRYDAKPTPKMGACVSCPACSREIPLADSRLPAEFSVPCPRCGQRKIYRSSDAHEPREGMETAKTSGRTLVSTDRDRPAEPKSWLGECASWLMQ
jgi:predicted RNA-binding Zn-ribbon protein involved in translation (DUF1610 family)